MKSSRLMILLVSNISLVGLNSSVANNPLVLINNNGVKIYQKDYEKMLKIGVSERKINYISQEELDDFSKMNIIAVSESTNYIDSYNSFKQIKNSNRSSYSSNTIGSEKIKTCVTWYNIENVSTTYYYVSVDLTWSSSPKDRLTDMIGIYFGSENQIQYVNTSSGQKPKFYSDIMYEKYYYYDYKSSISSPEHEEYNTLIVNSQSSYSNSDASYSIGDHFTVKYNLPTDKYVKTEPYSDYGNQESLLIEKYTDFTISLSAYFAPVSSTVIRSSYSGYYCHQTSGSLLDFTQVTFSTASPFISVNAQISGNKSETISSTTFVEK